MEHAGDPAVLERWSENSLSRPEWPNSQANLNFSASVTRLVGEDGHGMA